VAPGVVEGLERLGLRGDVCFGAVDAAPDPRPLPALLVEHEALADAAAAARRSRFRVGLAAVPESSDALIAATARLVAEHGRLHVHLHEVREEVTTCRPPR
jgi:5-methylthioadenosine/S-adenosylhomocysteine deaminase